MVWMTMVHEDKQVLKIVQVVKDIQCGWSSYSLNQAEELRFMITNDIFATLYWWWLTWIYLKPKKDSSEVLIWLAYPTKVLKASECERERVWKLAWLCPVEWSVFCKNIRAFS